MTVKVAQARTTKAHKAPLPPAMARGGKVTTRWVAPIGRTRTRAQARREMAYGHLRPLPAWVRTDGTLGKASG